MNWTIKSSVSMTSHHTFAWRAAVERPENFSESTNIVEISSIGSWVTNPKNNLNDNSKKCLQSKHIANVRAKVLPPGHLPEFFRSRLFYNKHQTKGRAKPAQKCDTATHDIAFFYPRKGFISLWHVEQASALTAAHVRKATAHRR